MQHGKLLPDDKATSLRAIEASIASRMPSGTYLTSFCGHQRGVSVSGGTHLQHHCADAAAMTRSPSKGVSKSKLSKSTGKRSSEKKK